MDVIDQLNWYQFPVEIRELLPTLFLNVQQPVLIECFGGISCCPGGFRKSRNMLCFFSSNKSNESLQFQVLNCGYSYFTVLRKFTD